MKLQHILDSMVDEDAMVHLDIHDGRCIHGLLIGRGDPNLYAVNDSGIGDPARTRELQFTIANVVSIVVTKDGWPVITVANAT